MTGYITATTDYDIPDVHQPRYRWQRIHRNDADRDPWLAVCGMCLLPDECVRSDGEMKPVEVRGDRTHSLCIIYEATKAGLSAEQAIAIHQKHEYIVFRDCVMDKREEWYKADFLDRYTGSGPEEHVFRGIIYHVYHKTANAPAAVDIPLLCRFIITNDDPVQKAKAVIRQAHQEEQRKLRAWYEAVRDYGNEAS